MNVCIDVSEPKAEATTNWPPETTDRCFVVCSPNRKYFLVAESVEEKNDWIQKLTAAKDEFNKDGSKVPSASKLSKFKSLFSSSSSRQTESKEAGAEASNETPKEAGKQQTEEQTGDKPTEGDKPAEGDKLSLIHI